MTEWLKSVSLEDLKFLAPALFVFENEPEDAAIFMYKEGYAQQIAAAGDKDNFKKQSKQEIESRPPKKYWEQVKSENIHSSMH